MTQPKQPILTSKYLNGRINKEGYDFFKDVVAEFSNGHKPSANTPVFICVTHAYEGSLPMIHTVANMGEIVALIPKNSTKTQYPHVVDVLKQSGIKVRDDVVKSKSGGEEGKTHLDNPAEVIKFIKDVVPEGRRFILMDHGGYFAPTLTEIQNEFQDRLVGVSEFTDNGHKRYEKLAVGVTCPIVSVAHSKLKRPADKEAGEAVAHAIDHVLRHTEGLKAKNPGMLKIGIIGYGRLGSAAAKQLKSRGAEGILVTDTDYINLANAPSSGFIPTTIDDIVEKCDVIISATGAKALKPYHYAKMKDGAYIATVTSPDDELDIERLKEGGTLVADTANHLTATYKIGATGKKVHIIANGESANTLMPAGIGDPTLFLPEAEYLAANIKLRDRPNNFVNGIQEIGKPDKNNIARMWLEHFHGVGLEHGASGSRANRTGRQ